MDVGGGDDEVGGGVKKGSDGERELVEVEDMVGVGIGWGGLGNILFDCGVLLLGVYWCWWMLMR